MEMMDVPLAKYNVLLFLINSLSNFPIFKEDSTYLSFYSLPFFEDYDLLEAKSFSCIPIVTIHYLWNRESDDIIKLDGTNNAFFKHLDKLSPVLNRQTIIPYLKFVLNNVQNEEGTLRLTESIDEIDFSSLPSIEDKKLLLKLISPASIIEKDDSYYVCCKVIYGVVVYEAEIRLQYNGMFDFIGERQLCENMSCLRPIFLE